MKFWKVYREDLKNLNLIVSKEYCSILSENNSHFKQQVLDLNRDYFYISRNNNNNEWEWMPKYYSYEGNRTDSYHYFIGRKYLYKGDFSRLIKLKKLESI